MEKSKVLNFLTKYYLGGTVEDVVWNINNKQLTVKFRSPDKSVMGIGVMTDFDVQDSEFGVIDTSKFISAISPLDSNVNVDLTTHNNKLINIIFSDNDCKNTRTLASADDEVMINKFKGFAQPDSIFETIIPIDATFVSKFNKTKNIDTSNIDIKINNDNTADFIVGNNTNQNVDTGKFNVAIESGEMTIKPTSFKLDIVNKILSVNKDFESGKIKFCFEHGVLKFEFVIGDIAFIYYTVAFK